MFTDDVRPGSLRVPSTHVWVTMAVAAAALCLVALEIHAIRTGFNGPLHILLRDYVSRPTSQTMPWAGLGLAVVGLSNRRRLVALALAVGIDAVFAVERMLRGGALVVGNGPLIVLTALPVVAWLRWTGAARTNALRAASLGVLLILSIRVCEAWLHITAISRPLVLDEYVLAADHALGQPAWRVGRIMAASGPIPPLVLDWVYCELAMAAMVVALYQLRNVNRSGWPQHYLVRTFLVLGMIGPIIYMLFPVVGPVYAFGASGHGVQLGIFWPHALPPVDLSPAPLPFDSWTPRNCMPSLHTAWALGVFIHSRGGPRWLRWCGTFWLVGTLTATLGFGFHYGVDLVAGALLCLTVESALRDPERGWGWWRIQLVGGGATLLAVMMLAFRYLAEPMARWPLLFGPLILGALAVYVVAFYTTFFGRSVAPRDRVAMYRIAVQGKQQPDPLYD